MTTIRPDLGTAWLSPSVDNTHVWRAWLNAGPKGLASEIVLSIPAEFRTGSLGLPSLLWLARRVLTTSDDSLGVEQGWFNQPPPVTKPWLLGNALVRWIRVRQALIAGKLPPAEVACRLSLRHLSSGLADLRPTLAALEEAHPTGIPVDLLLARLQAKAAVWSSAREAQRAVAQYAEGYGAAVALSAEGAAAEGAAGGSRCCWGC